MAVFPNAVVDTRATNVGITLLPKYAEWKQAFANNIVVESQNTWYPFFDEGAYLDQDARQNFKMGQKTTPKEISLEYSKKELVIEGYETSAFMSALELNEAKAGSIVEVEDDMIGAVLKQLNHFVDLDFIDMISSTSLWNNNAVTDAAFSAVWTDQTNGDPELDLRLLREYIIKNTRGMYRPNTIITNTGVLDKLFMHTKIKNRYDYVVGSQEEKKAYFMNLLGIEKIVEIRKTTNTAKKGQTASLSSYMGNVLWMGYIEPNPTRTKPTAMAPIVLRNFEGDENGVAFTKMSKLGTDSFEDGRSGIKVIGRQFTAVKQIAKDMGYLLTGIYS